MNALDRKDICLKRLENYCMYIDVTKLIFVKLNKPLYFMSFYIINYHELTYNSNSIKNFELCF